MKAKLNGGSIVRASNRIGMELSPLIQLLIVAVLAYGAGLLLGLSFYRGEIGPAARRRGAAAAQLRPAGARSSSEEESRRRRRRRRTPTLVGERIRQVLALGAMLAVITAVCLGVYGAMRVGAEIVLAAQPDSAQRR